MPVPRGLVNACEPGGVSRRYRAYELADRGGDESGRATESGCNQKRGPSVFCCLPHLSEIRNNVRLALRARMFHAQQIASYPIGGKLYAD
jgi:hypothetical protein